VAVKQFFLCTCLDFKLPAEYFNAVNNKIALLYPFDFAPTGEFEIYTRDERGIPKVFYPHLQRHVYNPITIAQYGLHQLALFASGNDSAFSTQALLMADWLAEHLETWQNTIGAWVFDFDLPFYGPRRPWISALAQGQGLSLLLRAGQLQPGAAYEEACQRAVRAFYFTVAQGGVASNFPGGALAFEEYPTREPSLVLNGILFALLGLHDYAQYFGDARAHECFAAGVLGVKQNLFRYDTGYWNLYDLHRSRRLASPMYVDIHVRLLRAFATITGEDAFAKTAGKWQRYLNSSFCRARFYGGKVVEKIRLRFEDYTAPV